MNKQQFMAELKQLLGELPVEERDEALSYYEDYFADAGEGNEDRIIAELGSPEKVAYTIKSGLEDVDKSEGEFTENGFLGYESPYKDELTYTEIKSERRSFIDFSNIVNNRNNLILFIIVCVLLIPVIIPAIASLFGILFGIAASVFCVMFALAIAGLAVIVAGALVTAVGIGGCFTIPMAGIIIIGAGLMLLGLGSILFNIGIKIATRLFPAVLRFISKIGGTLFNRFAPNKEGMENE